jgi:hypothetical protein
MDQNSKDPRIALGQLVLQSAVRGLVPGSKASEDCKKVREGVEQFPIEQFAATVNLNVVLQDDGFIVVGGVAGNIMAVRALLLILDAQIDEQSPPSESNGPADFLGAIMGEIMGGLMENGGSKRKQETKKPEESDSKQPSEADAHLAETFGDIKSPVIPVES